MLASMPNTLLFPAGAPGQVRRFDHAGLHAAVERRAAVRPGVGESIENDDLAGLDGRDALPQRIGLDLGQGVALVTAYHLIRIFIIIPLAPLLYRLFRYCMRNRMDFGDEDSSHFDAASPMGAKKNLEFYPPFLSGDFKKSPLKNRTFKF